MILSLSGIARGAEYQWNAATGNYADAANWLVDGSAPETAPDTTSAVLIQSGTSTLSTASAASVLTIGGGTGTAEATISSSNAKDILN